MAQGVALGLTGCDGALTGASLLLGAGGVLRLCAPLQWCMAPLAIRRAHLRWTQYSTMPIGHLQCTVAAISACNHLLASLQVGVLSQAGFTYMHAAWAEGDLFSGAGESNPFLDDIRVHLPSGNAIVGAPVNAGFWLPCLLQLASALLPGRMLRVLVSLFSGRRPLLARWMAPDLPTCKVGPKKYHPNRPTSAFAEHGKDGAALPRKAPHLVVFTGRANVGSVRELLAAPQRVRSVQAGTDEGSRMMFTQARTRRSGSYLGGEERTRGKCVTSGEQCGNAQCLPAVSCHCAGCPGLQAIHHKGPPRNAHFAQSRREPCL